MIKKIRPFFIIAAAAVIVLILFKRGILSKAISSFAPTGENTSLRIGQVVDSLNGVAVYYNGSVGHTAGRNTAKDGYNLGLKYQCVEFVKRYYYEHLNHKMPDSYGHAKSFFDRSLGDGTVNNARNLIQYRNSSKTKPCPDDLVIFDATAFNPYGHVAIVSAVSSDEVEIIQQNPGPSAKSQVKFALRQKNGKWVIGSERLLGWLRKSLSE